MTINIQNHKFIYTGNGTTRTFYYNSKVKNKETIRVYLKDQQGIVNRAETRGYTYTTTQTKSTGYVAVEFNIAPPSDWEIAILSVAPYNNDYDFNNPNFNPFAIGLMGDSITEAAANNAEAMRTPPFFTGDRTIENWNNGEALFMKDGVFQGVDIIDHINSHTNTINRGDAETLGGHPASYYAVASDLDMAEVNIAANQAKNTAQDALIAANQANITLNSMFRQQLTAVGFSAAKIADIESAIAANAANITGNDNDIATLQSQIQTIIASGDDNSHVVNARIDESEGINTLVLTLNDASQVSVVLPTAADGGLDNSAVLELISNSLAVPETQTIAPFNAEKAVSASDFTPHPTIDNRRIAVIEIGRQTLDAITPSMTLDFHLARELALNFGGSEPTASLHIESVATTAGVPNYKSEVRTVTLGEFADYAFSIAHTGTITAQAFRLMLTIVHDGSQDPSGRTTGRDATYTKTGREVAAVRELVKLYDAPVDLSGYASARGLADAEDILQAIKQKTDKLNLVTAFIEDAVDFAISLNDNPIVEMDSFTTTSNPQLIYINPSHYGSGVRFKFRAGSSDITDANVSLDGLTTTGGASYFRYHITAPIGSVLRAYYATPVMELEVLRDIENLKERADANDSLWNAGMRALGRGITYTPNTVLSTTYNRTAFADSLDATFPATLTGTALTQATTEPNRETSLIFPIMVWRYGANNPFEGATNNSLLVLNTAYDDGTPNASRAVIQSTNGNFILNHPSKTQPETVQLRFNNSLLEVPHSNLRIAFGTDISEYFDRTTASHLRVRFKLRHTANSFKTPQVDIAIDLTQTTATVYRIPLNMLIGGPGGTETLTGTHYDVTIRPHFDGNNLRLEVSGSPDSLALEHTDSGLLQYASFTMSAFFERGGEWIIEELTLGTVAGGLIFSVNDERLRIIADGGGRDLRLSDLYLSTNHIGALAICPCIEADVGLPDLRRLYPHLSDPILGLYAPSNTTGDDITIDAQIKALDTNGDFTPLGRGVPPFDSKDDVGKVLGVNPEGKLAFATPPSSGGGGTGTTYGAGTGLSLSAQNIFSVENPLPSGATQGQILGYTTEPTWLDAPQGGGGGDSVAVFKGTTTDSDTIYNPIDQLTDIQRNGVCYLIQSSGLTDGTSPNHANELVKRSGESGSYTYEYFAPQPHQILFITNDNLDTDDDQSLLERRIWIDGSWRKLTNGNNNTASGGSSFATGGNNTASGYRSFATGDNNTASGWISFATGRSNTNSIPYSAVFGRNNRIPSGTILGAGNNASLQDAPFRVLDNGSVVAPEFYKESGGTSEAINGLPSGGSQGQVLGYTTEPTWVDAPTGIVPSKELHPEGTLSSQAKTLTLLEHETYTHAELLWQKAGDTGSIASGRIRLRRFGNREPVERHQNSAAGVVANYNTTTRVLSFAGAEYYSIILIKL